MMNRIVNQTSFSVYLFEAGRFGVLSRSRLCLIEVGYEDEMWDGMTESFGPLVYSFFVVSFFSFILEEES